MTRKRVRLVETPCKWHYESGIKFLVPGCWNRVHSDYADCHCYSTIDEPDELESDLVKRIERLEMALFELQSKLPAAN